MVVNQKNKVILVANIIEDARWAGPQKRITMVASALGKIGVETVVLLPEVESDRFMRELNLVEVAHYRLRLCRLGRGVKVICWYILSFVRDVLTLKRLLKSGRFDLVHVSGGAWQVKGAIAGRLAGIPVLWHLNDTQMTRPIVLLFRLLAKYLATGFIVTAHRVQNYYLDGTSLVNTPIFSVQAPVDTKKLDPQQVAMDKEISEFKGVKVISVANINPGKGFETLIDVAAILKDRELDFSVIIVGPVYETQQKYFCGLKDMIKRKGLDGHISFIGRREDIAASVHSADIFVCSSLAESGPMVVWEAMALECPVVSTDVGDVAQYIKNGKNGFVVPVQCVVAMADAIEKLICNPDLRREFGRRSRKVAQHFLDVEVIANCTADSYRAILDS